MFCYLPKLRTWVVGIELGRAGVQVEGYQPRPFGMRIAKATGGIMRRIDVVATRCLELAAKGKSNLVDATLAEAAIRDCAEALL